MLIFLELIFDYCLADGGKFFHLLDYLVVDRHGMKSNYQTDYFRLYSLNFLEKFQFS